MEVSYNASRSWIFEAMRVGLSLIFLNDVLATAMAAENPSPVLSADDVVNRMVRADEKRLSEFQGYTSTRRYSLGNKRVNKRARLWCESPARAQVNGVSPSSRKAAPASYDPASFES